MSSNHTATTPAQMRELIERHMAAEAAGDIDGALAVYTSDVVHDMVGTPAGVLTGHDQARGFYEHLTSNLVTVKAELVSELFGADHCVVEHLYAARVDGEFLGVPGGGRKIVFRLLHVFEFRDDLISRENVWMDVAAVLQQLTG